MTTQGLGINESTPALLQLPSSFSSSQWRAYFQENRQARVELSFSAQFEMSESLRLPLLRSLQRFQIGETGEGRHLKKYATKLGDPAFEQCIELFVREEQYHAIVIAQMIQSLDGTLLLWHWTGLAFVALRRMLALKTELFILLIAEIIGKCFYRTCAQNLENRALSDAFSLIVLDEIGHLEFLSSFLRDRMKGHSLGVRKAVNYCWTALFVIACLVFVADNRRALIALRVPPREFMRECMNTFHRISTMTLLQH